MDAAFGGFLLFKQIQGTMAKHGKVFGGLVFTDTAMILLQCNIQNPMQFVFDGPVLADKWWTSCLC